MERCLEKNPIVRNQAHLVQARVVHASEWAIYSTENSTSTQQI